MPKKEETTKWLKHKHSRRLASKESWVYTELVKWIFHLGRKRFKWTMNEMEQEYRLMHDYAANNFIGYTDLDTDLQRLVLCVSMAKSLHDNTPEPEVHRLFKMVI